MVATKKLKAYVSEMTLRLGPVTANGKLVGVRTPVSKDKKSPFKMVTPEGKAVQQQYVDVDGSTWKPVELARAIEVDGELKIVEPEAAKAAKVSSNLPKNVLNLVAHNAADVDGKTFPSDKNAYVFVPNTNDPANAQYNELLIGMLAKSDKAMVGLASIRNVEGMYRLSVWRGHLIVQQQLYPEEINEHEVANTDSLLADKGLKIIEKLTIPFDPEMYRDASVDNIANFMASYEGTATNVKADTADTVVDIASALDAFLED